MRCCNTADCNKCSPTLVEIQYLLRGIPCVAGFQLAVKYIKP